MALYYYQAFTHDGKKKSGTLDAPTQEAVRDAIKKMGLYPIKIERASDGGLTLGQRMQKLFARSVSLKDKILFTKQLAVLLKSGVPLLQAFELLIEQFDGRLRTILVEIKDSIKEGLSLAESLKRYPETFDNIYVQLVRAGEATGKLDTILVRLTSFLERQEELRSKVRSAMREPLIQLVVILGVVGALLAFVVPQLAATFASDGGTLPLATRILMGASDFILNYWYILLGGLIFFTVIFRYWASTNSGRKTLDTIKLKIPIVSYFTRMNAITRFSRTLGMLLESGVNLSDALDIVVNVVDNRILSDVLKEARDKIIKQGRIAEFLKQTNLFPPIAIYLIKTGEESGNLDYMLLTVADNYEKDLAEYADGLSNLLQPIMLIIMGAVVGFVVMAIMQPMMEQANNLGGM